MDLFTTPAETQRPPGVFKHSSPRAGSPYGTLLLFSGTVSAPALLVTVTELAKTYLEFHVCMLEKTYLFFAQRLFTSIYLMYDVLFIILEMEVLFSAHVRMVI